MPTSGTTSWTMTESQIINRALRITGMIGTGDTPSSTLYADSRTILNTIIKSLMSEGITQWKTVERVTSFCDLSEVLGSDANSYQCVEPHVASLESAPISGSLYQDYWQLGGTSSTTSISGSSYTSSNQFDLAEDVLDIESMYVRDSGYDHTVAKMSYSDFFQISSKNNATSSHPTIFSIEHSLNANKVHFYPLPVITDSSIRIHYRAIIYYEDMTSSANNADFPVEYLDALVYLLASQLADEAHLELSERAYLVSRAEEKKRKAFGGEFNPLDQGIKGLYSYQWR